LFTWIEAWYNPHHRHSGLGSRPKTDCAEPGLSTVDPAEVDASPPVDNPAEVLTAYA
jgi:hypothetical protein